MGSGVVRLRTVGWRADTERFGSGSIVQCMPAALSVQRNLRCLGRRCQRMVTSQQPPHTQTSKFPVPVSNCKHPLPNQLLVLGVQPHGGLQLRRRRMRSSICKGWARRTKRVRPRCMLGMAAGWLAWVLQPLPPRFLRLVRTHWLSSDPQAPHFVSALRRCCFCLACG